MQKTIEVTIEGVCPMLMNRFQMKTAEEESGAARRDEQRTPEDEAEKGLYKTKDGKVFVPSTWIEAALRDAAKEYKKGKSNWKTTILSSVFVDPDEIPMGKTSWDEIDRRPAVIQRNRIVKSRPKFNTGWKISFKILFEDSRIKPDVIQTILTEAGSSKGIGDYRPKFGRFKVTSFK